MELQTELIPLQWWGFYIVVEVCEPLPEGFQNRFPRRIAGMPAHFTTASPFDVESALRLKLPAEADPDDNPYAKALRPGVMLAGLTLAGSELLTTSGVCVKSPSGQRFVTCAAHGFLPGSGDIYHPSLKGEKIGSLARTLGSSDISLFQVEDGFTYSRETFSEIDILAQPFRALGCPGAMKIGDIISLNTPFSGLCEATFIANRFGYLPSDEPGVPHVFYEAHVGYCGQHSGRFLDGCRGAPIWTNEFDVIGQFRSANKTGEIAYMPSYSHLVDEGFELSSIG